MDRRKMIILVLLVAVALAGMATYFIWSYLQSQQQEVERSRVVMTEIVSAAENIPIGSAIEERQLKKIRWPIADIPPGAFADIGPLIGRVAVSAIFKGELLMEAKLASGDGKTGTMAYIIPDGHRAMAVAVNDVAGVAGFVLPNSAVDVMVTTSQGGGQQISKIVLQNLRVLSVGQKMEEKEGKAIQVPTVTLSITPAEAEKLALAGNIGTLQLLLRGTKDNAPSSTGGASIPNLMSGGNRGPTVFRAAAREKEVVTITLIKSSKGETRRTEDSLVEEGGFWNKREGTK